MTDRAIRVLEWFVGWAIVRSAKMRISRGGFDDAHEVRHLFAAITAGNSTPCEPGGANCHLDAATMVRLHDASFPEHSVDDHAWLAR